MKPNTLFRPIMLLFVGAFLTTGCETLNAPAPAIEAAAAPNDFEQAEAALIAFFDRLHEGTYADAAALYGGSYDLLITYNPEIDVHDRAAMLQAACTMNGFLCLRIRNALLQEQISPSEYRFVVEFMNEDGSLFVRESCCGVQEPEEPPATQFVYNVSKDSSGNFLVQELPVYIP